MKRTEVTALVERAIQRVVDSEAALLDRDVAKRALSHHLARFISEGVSADYDVHVEYNRHFDDPKRLHLPRRDALDDELRATTVFPDIVVHVRGTDEHNLLVLEVKKPGEDRAYDERKLRAFRTELRYQHAAHVILGWSHDTIVRELIWIDE